ncbi:MAG: hypothetical protein IPM13_00490 [Phycisphaerales bacterium]|nr:hypothetical protein [Phycisphaerales bacterium]
MRRAGKTCLIAACALAAIALLLVAGNILYCLRGFAGAGLFVWHSPSADLELVWSPSKKHVIVRARGYFRQPPTDWVKMHPSLRDVNSWLYQHWYRDVSPPELIERGGLCSRSSTSGALCTYLFLSGRVADSARATLDSTLRDPGTAHSVLERALEVVEDVRSDADLLSSVLERLGVLFEREFASREDFELWAREDAQHRSP